MKMSPPRIRIIIEEVRMRGIPSRDGRRLIDTIERELTQLGPEIARLASLRNSSVAIERDTGVAIPAPRRIDGAGTQIAHSILKVITP